MSDEHPRNQAAIANRSRWVLLGFIAVAAFFLFSEHRAHFLGALPYLLLLACPLMHLFLHYGHHGHSKKAGEPAPSDEGEPK